MNGADGRAAPANDLDGLVHGVVFERLPAVLVGRIPVPSNVGVPAAVVVVPAELGSIVVEGLVCGQVNVHGLPGPLLSSAAVGRSSPPACALSDEKAGKWVLFQVVGSSAFYITVYSGRTMPGLGYHSSGVHSFEIGRAHV